LGGIGASSEADIDAQKRTTTAREASPAAERLLILAPNWLGDAVMALPAIAMVRETLPNSVIDIGVRRSIAPLFALVADVSRVVLIDKGARGLLLNGEGPYEAALLLANSFNSARLVWSAGIPERWGYRGDFRSLLLTRAIARPVRVHQADFYKNLVRELGFRGRASEPRLTVSHEHHVAGRALLETSGWDGKAPLVAVAAGAAFGSAKRWPAASFARLVDALAVDGIRTVLIGAAGDSASQEVRKLSKAPNGPFDIVGRTDLPTLAGVLLQCRTLATNDSGAMHFAAALQVPVTAMFGPTRDRETHPLGGGHAVLTNAVWCRPCMLRECPLTHRCMTGISVDAVLAAARARI
jgi:heptosyltransferase-2